MNMYNRMYMITTRRRTRRVGIHWVPSITDGEVSDHESDFRGHSSHLRRFVWLSLHESPAKYFTLLR
jgi:hypothetical protein